MGKKIGVGWGRNYLQRKISEKTFKQKGRTKKIGEQNRRMSERWWELGEKGARRGGEWEGGGKRGRLACYRVP